MADDKLNIACIRCTATNRLPASRLRDRPLCGRCKQALFTGAPVDLNAQNFSSVVAHTDLPILVDFWAAWCGPCQMMAPVYSKAAALLEPRVRVAKLDTEQAPEIAGRWSIRSIPTLVVFHRGQEIARRSGALDLNALVSWVESSLASVGTGSRDAGPHA